MQSKWRQVLRKCYTIQRRLTTSQGFSCGEPLGLVSWNLRWFSTGSDFCRKEGWRRRHSRVSVAQRSWCCRDSRWQRWEERTRTMSKPHTWRECRNSDSKQSWTRRDTIVWCPVPCGVGWTRGLGRVAGWPSVWELVGKRSRRKSPSTANTIRCAPAVEVWVVRGYRRLPCVNSRVKVIAEQSPMRALDCV